ncbi:hypothetical protein LINPERHAP1_LOCUS10566 [Linum perenne]
MGQMWRQKHSVFSSVNYTKEREK